MKIIVTGGTGFIGSELVGQLVQDGSEVVVLTRREPQSIRLPLGARLIKWDARTAKGWGHEAEGAAAIVNLAGEPIAPLPWFGSRKMRIRASRVNTGRAIVEAVQAARIKPRAVIQASAIGYYGLHDSETVTETTPPGRDFLASVCQDWENATVPVEALGVRRAIYRTGLVLGRHGGILPLMALPFHFFVGGPLGSGKQWMSWIHLADEIAALRLLIASDQAHGVYNLTAPNPVTNADFARALGRALGRPSWFPAPAPLLRLVFGDMAHLMLLNGQRVLPTRLQQLGFRFRYPELDRALGQVYGVQTNGTNNRTSAQRQAK